MLNSFYRDPEFTPALLVETKEEMENKLARKVAQIMLVSLVMILNVGSVC